MGRKKKELESRNGITGKTCGKCKEWKSIDNFNNDKYGVGGKQHKCKPCQSLVFKKYYEGNEELLEKKRKYWRENREKRILYSKKYYAENQEKFISYREAHRDKYAELTRKWRKENRERGLLITRNRRARILMLQDDLTPEEQESIIKKFNGCAFTKSNEYELDHVIPLSIGHGGTTYGNMIPLRKDLNQSKGNKNIFEWFEANRQRFNLNQIDFDNLIIWLSEINSVSVEDYKDYVYWCHENPHHIDDLRDENEREAK